jgi:sialate O-acetylesterase
MRATALCALAAAVAAAEEDPAAEEAPSGFRFHPVFGDAMVLQASTPSSGGVAGGAAAAPLAAAVFGTGCSGKIEVTLDGQAIGHQAQGVGVGEWRVELPPMPPSATGATLVASCGSSTATLTDVVFGDVYITSGQSNMELPIEHTFSYWNASLNATGFFDAPDIRVTKVPHNLQLARQATLDEPLVWSRASYTALKGHSAISYYFAAELRAQMGASAVPIGIVESSWGGTIIESWISKEAQAACSDRICGPDAPQGKVCNALHRVISDCHFAVQLNQFK